MVAEEEAKAAIQINVAAVSSTGDAFNRSPLHALTEERSLTAQQHAKALPGRPASQHAAARRHAARHNLSPPAAQPAHFSSPAGRTSSTCVDMLNVGAEEEKHTSAEALEGLFVHLVQEEHHVLEEAARTIQKIYRGKIARRQHHARLHALEHEVEEAIEEGVKEMLTFVMGTKNTKRPEKLPVRHICKELVQARLWRGWVLFVLVFVCAAAPPGRPGPSTPAPWHAS